MVSIICQKISQNGRSVLDISRTQIFADISKKYSKKVWKIDFHEKWKKFHYSYLICRIQCKKPQVHTLLSSKVSFKWYTTPLKRQSLNLIPIIESNSKIRFEFDFFWKWGKDGLIVSCINLTCNLITVWYSP